MVSRQGRDGKAQGDEVRRIGAAQAAVISFSKNGEAARKFIDFLLSPESEATFRKYQYFGSSEEAFRWLGAKKPVGGEYAIPREWVVK